MIIENFKLKEFLLQENSTISRYMVALSYIKTSETKKKVFHMKLREVEFIKKNIFSNNDESLIEIVAAVQDIKKEEVYNIPIITFFGLVASIKEQLEIIAKAEESSLTPSEVNIKWEAVGGSERMAKFGIYNTLEDLSGGDALKYKRYMNMDYSEIFTILLMRKTSRELVKEMDAIKLNKN